MCDICGKHTCVCPFDLMTPTCQTPDKEFPELMPYSNSIQFNGFPTPGAELTSTEEASYDAVSLPAPDLEDIEEREV